MKDVSEKLEEVILGTWEKPKPLPDRIYFMKVFRRNLGVFFLGAGVTIIVALSLPYLIENTYKSSVHAIFDHVDVSGSGLGISPQVRYNTVARLFRARFESQDFLSEIAGKLGGRAAFMQEGPMAQFILNPIKSKLGLINKSDSTADDRVALSQVLSKQLDAFPEPESGVLTLSAYTASPKLSQSLANEAMELFIRKELDEQIRSLDIKLDFLQKNSLREAPPKIQKEKVQVVESRSARVNRLQVDDQQTESEDRLRSLNVQLDNLKIEREQSLTAVSRELVKLQTSLQPNHPQVIEKRKEIDLLNSQYAAHEAKLMSNLDEARAQLRGLRSLQPIPGPAGQSTSSVSSIDYRGNFFMAVTDRIKDIELERKNLQRQRDDVKLRTRLRIIFPAAYEPIPYKNNRRNLSLTLAAAGAALTFLFIAFRELRNSKARDVWRIERGSGQSIVAQISLKSATEFADITPKLADQLRTHLSKISKVDDAARTLLSYRRLELAMVKGCQGRLVMLINAGPFDETAKVIKNFLNIYATDHQDDYLLI
ncbi:MAG: hypothetical protein NTX25_13425, partial [Proteobacteria bacterium]|nr:hypothetical protein [Pseudomonadota bacterium]